MEKWKNSKNKLPIPGLDTLIFYDNRYHLGYFCGFSTSPVWRIYEIGLVKKVKFWIELPNKPNDSDFKEN